MTKVKGTRRRNQLKSGKVTFTVQFILRSHAMQDSRTFDNERLAKAWQAKRAKEIQADLDAGRTPISSRDAARKHGVTLGDVIDKYVQESMTEIGRTKAQVLTTIRKEYDIADMSCDQITSQDIIAFAKELHRRPGLNSAATVLNYLSHLSSVFAIARPSWGYPLDEDAMKDGLKVCKRMGFTAKAKKRDRRPTLDELDRLMSHFAGKVAHRPKSTPMHRVVAFAIFSTRRQEEICRITWADYEPTEKRIMVRDMKHPGDKAGNDQWVTLPDPCCAIIDAMPRIEERIFPFTSDSLSAAFTRACKALEIDDLHFHDLRHEGTSRLFEMGQTIAQVGVVTGHRSWQSLQRYTHHRQTGDKFENWPWIDVVTKK